LRTEHTGKQTPDMPSSSVGVTGVASGCAWQDDGTGLQHTPGYTQCRCGGRTYTLTGVTRTLVHALDSLSREGITTPLEEDLVNRAKELYSSDLEMVKRLNGLRRRRMDKIFAEGGVWKTLVIGYRQGGGKKGSYRLNNPRPA